MPPPHVIKSFLGVETLYRGDSTLQPLPSNTALVVGPWEWGTLERKPGNGEPWG